MDGSGPPRGVLAGFVSTSVLTSSDGLFGDHVEEQRLSEAPAPRPEDAPDYRPLFERLQEMKDKKDSEWKEKNNPFAPPKALDEEDISFIRDLETRQADTERRRKEQHEQDVASFLLARGTAKPSAETAAVGAVAAIPLQKPKDKAQSSKTPSVMVVRAKRKAGDGEGQGKRKKKSAKVAAESSAAVDVAKSSNKRSEPSAENATEEKKPASAAQSASVLGLVAYSSDSD